MNLREYMRDIKLDIARAKGKADKLLCALTTIEESNEQEEACFVVLEQLTGLLESAEKEIEIFRRILNE